MLPTPKATTSTAVILFLESGNWVHMQFKMGIELIPNMDPGIMIEKMTNVIKLKATIFTRGDNKKMRAHTLSTN